MWEKARTMQMCLFNKIREIFSQTAERNSRCQPPQAPLTRENRAPAESGWCHALLAATASAVLCWGSCAVAISSLRNATIGRVSVQSSVLYWHTNTTIGADRLVKQQNA